MSRITSISRLNRDGATKKKPEPDTRFEEAFDLAAEEAADKQRYAFTHLQTTAAQAGAQKPADVPASVFELGRLAARGGPRPPLFDPAKVLVESGLPLPVSGNATARAYADLRARMKPGDSVLLPLLQAKGLVASACRLGANMVWRKEGATHGRAWLLDGPIVKRKQAPRKTGGRP